MSVVQKGNQRIEQTKQIVIVVFKFITWYCFYFTLILKRMRLSNASRKFFYLPYFCVRYFRMYVFFSEKSFVFSVDDTNGEMHTKLLMYGTVYFGRPHFYFWWPHFLKGWHVIHEVIEPKKKHVR